ncbi:transcriptional regulator [Paraneptunicella aestuarii]|uniref:methanogen output domain 1-containing protein n=1 Tax=Paraneptunicella aestuarii TaxID=2831148 RepID=UPI001E445D20|nr:methanogen output domain 1-containing protein [Paraneptunicella aestuarii]UAA39006.1 transcriptional regulator [Paraneptunicella aestuarii]
MENNNQTQRIPVRQLDVPLERDVFLRSLVRELSGVLEEVVGLQEAEGFISIVGQNMGNEIDSIYKQALQTNQLNKGQIADVLENLKARIQGEFYVITMDENKVVFGNHQCPFGDKVKDRPSLCMMTSNVFGTITANNNGYAKVHLKETIAQGAAGCQVTVYFTENEEADAVDGREYFKSE